MFWAVPNNKWATVNVKLVQKSWKARVFFGESIKNAFFYISIYLLLDQQLIQSFKIFQNISKFH